MKSNRTRSIASYYLRFIILTTAAVALIMTLFFIIQSFSFFYKVEEQTREQYVETQKRMIKDEVRQAVTLILHEKNRMDEKLRELLRERVQRAYDSALSLYNEAEGNYPEARIKELITESLRPVRYDDGVGYIFIGDLKGNEILYPVVPEYENTYVWDLQDSHGNYVMQDEVAMVKNHGEGFVEAYWRKPGGSSEMVERKLSFVKLFEPFGWYIGTGEYINDYKKTVQQNILSMLEQIRYGNNDILFGGTWEGISLLGPEEAKGKSMIDVEDVNGVKIVQNLIRIAKDGAGFTEYVMPEALSNRPLPKVSYVMGIPEWRWYIGASFYKLDVNRLIEQQEHTLKKALIFGVGQILVILAVLIIAMLFLSRLLYKNIKTHFSNFLSFLHLAATEFVSINLKNIDFSEFHSLGTAANQMIEERNLIQEKLQKTHKELSVLMENSPDFINTITRNGIITYTNRRLPDKKEPVAGRSILDFISEDYRAAFEEKIRYTFTRKKETEIQILSRDEEWFLSRFIPIIFEGVLAKVMVISSDISNRKKTEQEISDNLHEKEVLLREIHHRVKNNLQIISSILNLQLYRLKSEQDPSIFIDCKNRITTMALIHEQLYRTDKFSEIRMNDYITDLVWSIRDSIPNPVSQVDIIFDVAELSFNIDTAIPCGLIIHELLSNSLKYAFPDNASGTINLSLHRGKESGTFLLEIRDNGIGLPQKEDFFTRDTLGIKLVEALTEQLNGKYTFETDGGVLWSIVFTTIES